MMGKTHLGIGLLAGAAAPAVGLPGPVGLEVWAALAVGSLLPDLDSGAALITSPSQWLPAAVPVPGWIDGLAGLVGRLARAVFGHRGLLHWPILAAGLALAGWRLGLAWLVWLAVGYGVHLLADAFTVAGLPVFAPVSNRRFGVVPAVLRVKAGGFWDKALLAASWGGLAWLVVPGLLRL